MHILGVLLVGSWDFKFLGFYMNYNKEATGLTFRRGSKVSQVSIYIYIYIFVFGCICV